MKLPMNWLSDFTDVKDKSIKEYCDRMTDTGSKVEGWESLGEDIVNVALVKITSVEKHPDADKLQICQCDAGDKGQIQIVTAATNVFPGAYVPCALAPATLPGGVTIKKGKLRGVESNGMFCSIAELNLTLHDMPEAIEDGILIIPEEYVEGHKLGDDIRDVLSLRGDVVEFEITPNRPDCLSIIGLARETGVSFGRPVTYHTPEVKGCGGDIAEYLSVAIDNAEKCPRYTARVVKNVKIAPSPLWMRTRLREAGVRPINNIVDITNYVMLEYGQPMHAFDYSCLDGSRIVVREAAQGESFKSLDDIEHTLSAGMLVIADEKKAVALAGVMGGANSEITENTATVVFESANFMGSSVRITSRALGMRTESSGRFEKGLDAENTLPAVQRACELVELLGAGEVVDGIIDVYPGKQPEAIVKLEPERINSFLGLDVDEEYMKDVLRSLDFTIEGDMVHVPSFRADVRCMNDLAEEVLRIYGYNTIKSTAFTARVRPGSETPHRSGRHLLAERLCSRGLYEIRTFSFISPKYYDKLRLPEDSPLRKQVVIRNPLGEDTSVMRSCLLPSVLEALARNNNYHSEQACSLFECAATYIPNDDQDKLPEQPYQCAIASYGHDFYWMKGIIEDLLDVFGIANYTVKASSDIAYMHPGRCAEIVIGHESLAHFGELHPLTSENYGFDQKVNVAVIDYEALLAHASFEHQYTPLPKYPASERDFAFICDEQLEAGAIEAVMKKAGGKLIEKIKVFDVYKGAQVPNGKKSIAFNVILRAPDRTITVEEADKAAAKITSALEKELGITLRG